MSHKITIYFDDKNIKKYIKNHGELVIKNESFKIKNYDYIGLSHFIEICIDSQEKLIKINKLFDFFIKHNCFFHTEEPLLFDIDKDLFYKSAYCFRNPKYDYTSHAPNYLALTYDDNIIQVIKHRIDVGTIRSICNIDIDFDLGVVDFLVNKCKSELSKEYFDEFIKIFVSNMCYTVEKLISKYGINFFRCLHKNNILDLFLEKNNHHWIIYLSIKTNQTEIIDYLLKYGLEKDKVMIEDFSGDLLISLIKNDNTETFMYTIQNVRVSDIIIQKIIEGSGEFITKEYVEILLNNDKLNLENLELLKKSIKNNPDKKLKKYIKKLILNEKN